MDRIPSLLQKPQAIVQMGIRQRHSFQYRFYTICLEFAKMNFGQTVHHVTIYKLSALEPVRHIGTRSATLKPLYGRDLEKAKKMGRCFSQSDIIKEHFDHRFDGLYDK